jgi:hypothetical protein
MKGKTMLDTITKDYALWYIKDLKAKQAWYAENDYCIHGHYKYTFSYDMENDCFACENGEERDIYREALSKARFSRDLKALEWLKIEISAGVPDAELIRYIKRNF